MIGQYLPQTNEKWYSMLQYSMWLFLPFFHGSKHSQVRQQQIESRGQWENWPDSIACMLLAAMGMTYAQVLLAASCRILLHFTVFSEVWRAKECWSNEQQWCNVRRRHPHSYWCSSPSHLLVLKYITSLTFFSIWLFIFSTNVYANSQNFKLDSKDS